MNRNIMLALVGGFAVGAVAGYVFGSANARESAPVIAAVPTSPAPPPMPGQGLPNPDALAQIAKLEAATKADPKNHDAWVSLGNGYFDTHQPLRAIEAYNQALALKPKDPDVLTDQGVMFREAKQFDKAVANFKKAHQIDPKHMQSLFNLGIVYASDLNKPSEAKTAWNQVIQEAPDSTQAAQAKQALASLQDTAAK